MIENIVLIFFYISKLESGMCIVNIHLKVIRVNILFQSSYCFPSKSVPLGKKEKEEKN